MTEAKTGGVAIKFFTENIFKQDGSPSVLLTNEGPAFSSDARKNELKPLGTYVRVTAAYSSESNSRAERMVQIIKSAVMRILMVQEVE